MTQSAVVLDFVQQFDDVGLSDFADQATPERWENVVMQAALDVPVALESFDVGKILPMSPARRRASARLRAG